MILHILLTVKSDRYMLAIPIRLTSQSKDCGKSSILGKKSIKAPDKVGKKLQGYQYKKLLQVKQPPPYQSLLPFLLTKKTHWLN